MQSRYTGHVTSTEWRWVILVSSTLVMLAFLPFLWVLISGVTGSEWQFMGALHGYPIAALDLAQVFQGTEGQWMTRFLHTPEPHETALISPVYALLGQTSRLTGLSPIAIFHAARVGATLFMYLAFYQLAANIWMRVRARQVFFIVAALGSGFGWLLVPLQESDAYLDVILPQAFPFYSALVNVHFPLAFACLALIASVVLPLFRPGGAVARPNLQNGGSGIFFASLILVLVYPVAFIPLALTFLICLGISAYQVRGLPVIQAHWFAWFAVPALPVLIYNAAVLRYNEVVSQIWVQLNTATPPNLLVFLLSFGLVLLFGLPGIYRAVRRFEPDGDQFMLIWTVVTILAIYLPTSAQLRFITGLMLPLAYFATRAAEDFWFNRLPRRYRRRVLVGLVPIIAASNIFVLILPLRPISTADFSDASGLLLQRDYLVAFEWIRLNTEDHEVVLTSPEAGLWLPTWTGASPVYGHPMETLNPVDKRRAVERWYRMDEASILCQDLLEGAFDFHDREYTVRYVVVGPQETRIGQSACVELLNPITRFGDVRLYAYTPDAFTAR